ncbi:MAG: 30S ribosomal protein S7 [Chlamydiae bacterium]|nr:30S ribosomal protein S7 [Chlamydiota bacterium]
MSRRRRAEHRVIEADPVYNSQTVAKFIQKLMLSGKKSIASRIVYTSIENFSKKTDAPTPEEAFERALENAKPLVEVKSRRIGGATYQVPVEIPAGRRMSMAMRWIIENAKGKAGRSMIQGLTQELLDCYNNQGATIKKKEDTHRMAEANKAFAHYRW